MNKPKSIQLPNGRKIGPGEPCFIVAEIGQNHQGDVYTATRLLKVAHEAGVDAVKFCKRHVPSDLTRAARDAPYLGRHSFGYTYGRHRNYLELSIDEYKHLVGRMVYNAWPEIFFATACDIQSLEELETVIDPPLYKVASRDIDNLPLLDRIAETRKPVILSTGMASAVSTIHEAIDTISVHHRQIILLHCVSQYPTPDENVGLLVMDRLRNEYGFDLPVGMSDHTPGIVAAQTAATMGAVMIEKHITLARAGKGSDHAASLEPEGIRHLVRNVRAIEKMMDHTWHEPSLETAQKLRRSLVTAIPIPAGVKINEEMLCLKSPGTGVPWSGRGAFIGARASQDIPADVTLQLTDVLAREEVPA